MPSSSPAVEHGAVGEIAQGGDGDVEGGGGFGIGARSGGVWPEFWMLRRAGRGEVAGGGGVIDYSLAWGEFSLGSRLGLGNDSLDDRTEAAVVVGDAAGLGFDCFAYAQGLVHLCDEALTGAELAGLGSPVCR